ncbi:unnamed protein product [Phaedon cochleariae]|uniref:C2H2-type domain-containing protein n=1 Tax=Phaedon cochleariae TaxID=80249 RepID=A0A9P0DLH2_PHACE|nr:unnamed protein product [Phaedon cochleariae]
MEVAMPMSGSAIDCYEDMFKEITRKLYGEDGLPDLSANDRLASTSQDRGLTPIEYEVDSPILKPDEHLTAFGLAALMQNGFPASGILNSGFQCHKPNTGILLGSNLEDKWISSEDALQWTQSKIATYNPAQKLFRCCECDCAGYLLRVAEHWLGTHSAVRAFHCPQCPYESAWARCVRIHLNRQHNINTDESCDTLTKDNPVLQEILKYLQRLKNKIENSCGKTSSSSSTAQNADYANQTVSNASPNTPVPTQVANSAASSNSEQGSNASKRYSCTFCPYATDRRDLFTRHENIHREEKPFQCYVCQKQFNRADHVKKHFLRMHRDHPYDLNRIRRHPPKNASGMSYYQKYNNSNPSTQSNDLSTIGSLSIPGFNNVSRNLSNSRIQPDMKSNGKSGSLSRGSGKKKGEKRFSCCYCSWSGVDNWCLKRHMNTHLKPFVCGLCDYKAARSERLATHVLKVHNKRACGKCNYLADDLTQLSVHQQEQHPLEQRNRSSSSSSSSNILRTSSFNASASTTPSTIANTNTTSYSQSQGLLKTHDLTTAAALLQQSNRFLQSDVKSWKNHMPKQHGAARLFNYMEASDGSEPESESRGAEDMSRLNLAHRIQSDFPEAGDVGQDNGEEELPLFVCQTCGCEFEDDLSLETHQYTHSAASPAKIDDSKENVDPDSKYRCRLCDAGFDSQASIISHMASHFSLTTRTVPTQLPSCDKRPRKQRQPKKVVLPFWDSDEVEVLRHLSGKLRKWRGTLSSSRGGVNRLIDKYMAQLVTRKGLSCNWCSSSCVSRYHTKRSLALHRFWRHSKKRYRCEHCDMVFKHRYQSVLHSSRVHTNQKTQFVPAVLPREPTHLQVSAEAACSSQDTSIFFSNSHAVYVPDATMTNAHKIGMSFFDHSFIHSNNAINNHMPIIIPTFPPN